MHDITVKWDVFDVSFHDYINKQSLINFLHKGNGTLNAYVYGNSSEFVNQSFNPSLIYDVK